MEQTGRPQDRRPERGTNLVLDGRVLELDKRRVQGKLVAEELAAVGVAQEQRADQRLEHQLLERVAAALPTSGKRYITQHTRHDKHDKAITKT
jgi:hypothetical protein